MSVKRAYRSALVNMKENVPLFFFSSTRRHTRLQGDRSSDVCSSDLAQSLDDERKAKGFRGPLHGVPVLVKDNLDSHDRMMTTAGSLALLGSTRPHDSFVVKKLREIGRAACRERAATPADGAARQRPK